MGMWEKDRLFGGKRLAEEFELGEPFVLYAGKVVGSFETDLGTATKSVLTVQKYDPSAKDGTGEVFNAGTLASAIAEKLRDQEPSDFPAIVTTAKVPSSTDGQDAYVIQYVGPFTGYVPDDLPPIDVIAEIAAEEAVSKAKRTAKATA